MDFLYLVFQLLFLSSNIFKLTLAVDDDHLYDFGSINDKLCEDPNDELCVFCNRFSKPPYIIEKFTGVQQFKIEVMNHLNGKFHQLGIKVLEKVRQRYQKSIEETRNIIQRLEGITMYINDLDNFDVPPLSESVEHIMNCILNAAASYVKDLQYLATEQNIENIADIQNELHSRLKNIASIPKTTLGDLIGQKNCDALIANIESGCEGYISNERVIDKSNGINEPNKPPSSNNKHSNDKRPSIYGRVAKIATEQKKMMCT
ncbi:hypothetical protein BBOV_II006845 [Babesia bovis T2Bo]|uniref:hypothetical protein n=1 Tax=Babesia bovis T2Bo TaxID=484906 RepID=UPI001C34C262|nr:hypothetical protein BBOV_II006845 [Babesia bovis T2Bo]KAG6440164.1 hypothetical protein BBOV_II006845 [Babesia bovis T2Bo]